MTNPYRNKHQTPISKHQTFGIWSLGIYLGFGAWNLVLATPVALAQPSAKPVRAADIAISPDIGYVIQTTEPTSATPSTPAPLIVHIHEAHVNLDAQRHIIAILEQLIQQHGLRLLLLEGGQGDASLAYLRAWAPADDRKIVAEEYLAKGLISGEEYMDMVSDHPLTLWGVERQALYEQHINAFIALEPLRPRVMPAVRAAREAAQRLAPRLHAPALLELSAAADSFERDTLSLADFAILLSDRATQAGLSLDTEAPQLATFVELSRIERTAADPGAIANNPRYAGLRAQLQPAILSEQLDTCLATLRRRLAVTPPSRQLQAVEEEIELVGKLLEQRLSPTDYRRIRALTLSGLAQRWRTVLPAPSLARQAGLALPSLERLDELEHALPELFAFYDLAHQRDEALVENALAKLRETGEPLAVLITGGFHAPHIGAKLRAAGVAVVSVAPNITTPTNEQLYQAVLRYKHAHGSLAEVEVQAGTAFGGK